MAYYLSSRTEILDELGVRVRDTAHARWPLVEKSTAVNAALRKWGNRVMVPFVHTLETGFTQNSWTVQVPNHVDPRFMRPQIQDSALNYENLESAGETWVDLVDYNVEPDGSGGHYIRVTGYRYDSDGRIIHWVSPGPLPSTGESVAAIVLLDSGTSMTITGSANGLPQCGFIKIGNEWIQYSGLADSGPTLTLSNLVRGIVGTTEATHSPDAPVDWGVGMDRTDLLEQLFSQCEATLHAMFLAYASETERDAHQFAMRYQQQMADEYWESYTCSFEPKLLMDLR